MRNVALALCRLSIGGWVGAAALFVVTSVAEQTHSEFGSVIRQRLALLRFPHYYTFGFSLLGIAFLGGLVSCRHTAWGRWRNRATLAALGLALVLMTLDYFAIYTPLVEAITPPGNATPSEFVTYHENSERINQAGFVLAVLAAVLAAWPGSEGRPAALAQHEE